jgi:hypothetical protein
MEIKMIIEYEAPLNIGEDEMILIMGEFNQWLPEPMKRTTGRMFEFEV